MKRNTVQCTLVLNAVNELKNHPTADEVYNLIAKEHPSVSRATVYRNLNKLAEEGQLARRVIPGGADRFDYRTDDHYHVRCLKCDRVSDVDMKRLGDLEKQINDAHGFEINSHDVVFTGICPDCKN